MPTVTAKWSTPVTEVERRLRKLEQVLNAAKAADGSIDLAKAKALAGTDLVVARMVGDLRWERYGTTLAPDQARRQFQELQQALSTVRLHDREGDGKLGFQELPYDISESKAHRLLLTAAMPAEVMHGDSSAPKAWISLDARREAEAEITARATHHAKSKDGAEAIKWEMRLKIAEGMGVDNPIINDVINYAEKDWRRFLPVVGEKYASGKGHLSDGELKARYGGDLKAYVEQTRARVEAKLLMSYDDFLAGKDLR